MPREKQVTLPDGWLEKMLRELANVEARLGDGLREQSGRVDALTVEFRKLNERITANELQDVATKGDLDAVKKAVSKTAAASAASGGAGAGALVSAVVALAYGLGAWLWHRFTGTDVPQLPPPH